MTHQKFLKSRSGSYLTVVIFSDSLFVGYPSIIRELFIPYYQFSTFKK